MTYKIVPIPKSSKEWAVQCIHPEHNPPMYIHIPNGYQLEYTCPECGHTRILRNSIEAQSMESNQTLLKG